MTSPDILTQQHQREDPPKNPPAFNIPGPVLVLGGLIVLAHLIRTYLLDADANYWVLNVFAFVPVFYDVAAERLIQPMARYWSPITHGFIHGDWTHLLVNMIWLAAFGSATARRFGVARFFIFMALATAAGALAHYLFHASSNVPVIGASGAVSACMGAAVRFAFTPGRPMSEVSSAPALSLIQSLANRNIMIFVVIWFAFNWLFGAGIIPLGVEGSIAWEAHMGGFLFGWIGFALFDKSRSRSMGSFERKEPR